MHDPFNNPTALIPRTRIWAARGDVIADDINVPGITLADRLLSVTLINVSGLGLDNPALPILGTTYLVTAGEDTAGTVTFQAASSGSIDVAVVSIYRAGVLLAPDAVVSWAADQITVADGATYVLTAGDVINVVTQSNTQMGTNVGGEYWETSDVTDQYFINGDGAIRSDTHDSEGNLLVICWYDADYGETVNAPWIDDEVE